MTSDEGEKGDDETDTDGSMREEIFKTPRQKSSSDSSMEEAAHVPRRSSRSEIFYRHKNKNK
jgi:hypothetical protein